MRFPRRSPIVFRSALALLAAASSAQAQEGDTWYAGVRLNAEHTDNAGKAQGETVSERQDEAELSLGGAYENRWVAINAGYQLSERRFSEGTQEDRSLLEGRSELTLGKPTDVADLILSHTRRTVLNAPDALDLLSNNDERTIVSAMPGLRWRPTGADSLLLRGQYSEVDYRFRPERASERVGASLYWQRSLSAIDQLTWSASASEVSFDAAPLADYDYRSSALSFQASLRELSYRLEAGYNESEPASGDGLSSPLLGADIQWVRGASQWRLNARQFITDNSTGSGNTGELGAFEPGESSAGELDQLERTRAELSWTSKVPCERCDLSISAFWQDDQFRVDAQDQTEQGVRFNIGYELGRQTSVSLSWEHRERSFQQPDEGSDYEQDRVRAEYQYRFINNASLQLHAGRHERRAEGDEREYRENLIGLGLGYDF